MAFIDVISYRFWVQKVEFDIIFWVHKSENFGLIVKILNFGCLEEKLI